MEQTIRFRKKVEKEDHYVNTLQQLGSVSLPQILELFPRTPLFFFCFIKCAQLNVIKEQLSFVVQELATLLSDSGLHHY